MSLAIRVHHISLYDTHALTRNLLQTLASNQTVKYVVNPRPSLIIGWHAWVRLRGSYTGALLQSKNEWWSKHALKRAHTNGYLELLDKHNEMCNFRFRGNMSIRFITQ